MYYEEAKECTLVKKKISVPSRCPRNMKNFKRNFHYK